MSAPPPARPADSTGTNASSAGAGAPRWSDPVWLDTLRVHGDPVGEACARALKVEGVDRGLLHRTIAQMKANDRRLPADAPKPLRDFFEQTYQFCDDCHTPKLPKWVDRDRVIRGQKAFMEHSFPAVLVMLCKSLPEGYAAPSMAKILNMSRDLTKLPFHRLMGTLQLLLDVVDPYSFERMGMGQIAGQEMRLMHAGVRANVAPEVLGAKGHEEFVATYGVPINQEDMAGTIIGFSLLVVDGLLEIGLPLAPEVAEDYYYIWRVFGHLMGLRYPGAPDDIDCLPQSLDEARAFYRAYARHYVGPTDYSDGWRERALAANPDGVALADAHVLMLGRMFGKVLSGQYNRNDARRSVEVDARGLFGKGFEHAGIHLFEKTIHQLIGDASSARIGVDPNAHGSLLGDLMGMLPSHLKGVGHRLSPELAIAFSKWIFQHLVRGTYPGDIVFPVPLDVEDLHELAKHGD